MVDWKSEAISNSEFDREIQEFIGRHPANGNIEGRKFTINYTRGMPFADICTKTVYIPSWVKRKLNRCELQFVVFHELAHIIYKHKDTPQYHMQEQFIADEYAARRQCRRGYAENTLGRLNHPHIIRGKASMDINPEEVKSRIENLRSLGLPW